MKQRDLDIGIIEREIFYEELLTVPFSQDDMVIIVPSNFPKNNGDVIPLSELAEQTWIIRENGSGTRQVTDTMLARTKLAPTRVLEFGSTQVIKETVKNGTGISYTSKVAVKEELEKGVIKGLTIEGYKDARIFYYVTNKSQPSSKALERFIETLENS